MAVPARAAAGRACDEPGAAEHGGQDDGSNFVTRIRGHGVIADLLRHRFERACRRHGYHPSEDVLLDTSQFVPPRKPSLQGDLF